MKDIKNNEIINDQKDVLDYEEIEFDEFDMEDDELIEVMEIDEEDYSTEALIEELESVSYNDIVFEPKHHNEFDLFKALRFNAFKNVTFAFDLEKNKFTAISHVDMTKKQYIGSAFLTKLNSAYKNSFGRSNNWLASLSLDDEKVAIQKLKFTIPCVEEYTNHPDKPNGVSNVDGFQVFNHFNHSKTMVEMRRLAKERIKKQGKYKSIADMPWKKYREIEFLLRFLTNKQENPAYDFNPKTNQHDIEVCIFEKFVTWITAVFDTSEKLGVMWTFYTPVQGAGKDVLFDLLLKPMIGKDFYTEIKDQQAIGNFNKEIDGKLLGVFNEIKVTKPADKITFNNNTKAWITNPEVMIYEKQKTGMYKKNWINILGFTNYDVMFQVEQNCRRHCIVQTPPCRLESAVNNNLDMDIQDFVNKLVENREDFYIDLLCLDYDINTVKFKAAMTPAKQHVIRRTNTMESIVAEYIKMNEISSLEKFLETKLEFKPEEVHDICSQVAGGFLMKDTAMKIMLGCKSDEWDAMKPAKQNQQLENIFGEIKASRYKDNQGKDRQKSIYRFNHYDTAALKSYCEGDFDITITEVKEKNGYKMEGFSF